MAINKDGLSTEIGPKSPCPAKHASMNCPSTIIDFNVAAFFCAIYPGLPIPVIYIVCLSNIAYLIISERMLMFFIDPTSFLMVFNEAKQSFMKLKFIIKLFYF